MIFEVLLAKDLENIVRNKKAAQLGGRATVFITVVHHKHERTLMETASAIGVEGLEKQSN